MDEEKSLSQYLEDDNQEKIELEKNETDNNESSSDDIKDQEEIKETKEEKLARIAKSKQEFRDLDDNEEIGDTGLTKADLKKDMTTPAENMSSLKKFSEKLDQEAEAARIQYGKDKEEAETAKQIEDIRKENESDNKFDDEYIDEEKNDKEEKKEDEKIYVDALPKKEETADNESDEKTPKKVILTNVKIRKVTDEMKKSNIFNELVARKNKKHKTTRVALINSGYIADVGPMSSPEIRDLSGVLSSKDQFGYWEFLYKIIHEKVVSTSIGAMNFETFLKSTALIELEILMYGLFSSTYPERNEFPNQCSNPKCNAKFNFKYANSDYMVFDDMDKEGNSPTLIKFRQLVSSQAIDAKGFFKQSKTNTLYRVPLQDSGYIVELRFPTLYNHLYDVIAQLVTEGLQDASATTLNRMPYIEKVLVPIDEDKPEKGYYEFSELTQKITLLSDLTDDDDYELEKAISENILECNHIVFKMHDVDCPICHKKLDDERVNFRDLLFMTHQIRSVRKR